MENPMEIKINNVEYIRKDSIKNEVTNTEGLKAVLVRSYAAGVHFGFLKDVTDTLSGRVVTLLNTRRAWYWKGAATLSQMALEGVNEPDSCKFSVEIPENVIINCIEIIPLSEKAFDNLKSVKEWKN